MTDAAGARAIAINYGRATDRRIVRMTSILAADMRGERIDSRGRHLVLDFGQRGHADPAEGAPLVAVEHHHRWAIAQDRFEIDQAAIVIGHQERRHRLVRVRRACTGARCERLWVEALHAASASVLRSAALHPMAPEALFATRLNLHLAARFAWRETPAMPIWLAHQDQDCEGCAPEWAGFGALFMRPAFAVEGLAHDRAQFALLAALAGDETLGAAAAATLRGAPGADIADAISLLVTSGVFAASF